MPKKTTFENLLSNIMETLTDSIEKQTAVSSHDEIISEVVTSQFSRLFGHQKPIRHALGGGKGGATLTWVLFEWLNYHLLTILCFVLVLGMLVQFGWSNASGLLNRPPSQVPRIQLPDQLFVNVAVTVGAQVNKALDLLQHISCGGDLKQLLLVVAGLWVAAVISSCCNLLTVLYIGFVATHTLPVLYKKYEDEVDGFVDNALSQFQHHYQNIPARRSFFMGKKRY